MDSSKVDFIFNNMLNRTDVIAVESRATKKPAPVFTTDLRGYVFGHVSRDANGNRIGSYSPDTLGMVKAATVDLDGGPNHKSSLVDSLGTAKAIQKRALGLGLKSNAARSRSGYGFHLWFFFSVPVIAEKLRSVLFKATAGNYKLIQGGLADPHANRGIEIFPKQNSVRTGGVGNMVWLPWFHSNSNGGGEFYDLESYKVLGVSDLSINKPETSEVINSIKLSIQPRTSNSQTTNRKSNDSLFEAPTEGVDNLIYLRQRCVVVKTLLEKSESTDGDNRMGNSERLRLAQIAKWAGFSEEKIVSLFRNQANFNARVSLANIRGINLSLPPPSCRRISNDLKFCNGRCEPILDLKSGTPLAFLKKKGKDGETRN